MGILGWILLLVSMKIIFILIEKSIADKSYTFAAKLQNQF